MRIRASRNGKQSMNDATFADCSGMWSATFLPTSYCQLNITYRCREISIDAVINAVVEGVTIVGREKKFHRLVWDRLREREKKKTQQKFLQYDEAQRVVHARVTCHPSISLPSPAPTSSPFPPRQHACPHSRFYLGSISSFETEQIHFGLIIATII